MAQHFWSENSPFFSREELENIHAATSETTDRPVSFVTRALAPVWLFLSSKVLGDLVAPNAVTLAGVLGSMQAFQLAYAYYRPADTAGGGPGPGHAAPAGWPPSSVGGAGAAGGGAQPMHESAMTSLRELGVRGAGYSDGVAAGSLGGAAPGIDNFLHAERPVQTATVLIALLLALSTACGSLDGVHARRCRSATSVGDIFSRVCASVSRVFIALTMLEILGIQDTAVRWYVLLSLQLIEFNTVLGRINAANIRKDKVKNWAYVATYCFRESELSFVMLLLLLARWCVPGTVAAAMAAVPPQLMRRCYWGLIALSFGNVALLRMRKRQKSSIALCLAARVVPLFYLLPLNDYNSLSLIGDAMVVGLLSTELYVSHIARRRLHAGVVFVCLFSLLNDVFAIVSSVLYVFGILTNLSFSLNVPLFVPVRNVFIDGVFDLCHAGHKIAMRNALAHGNRLIVGVCGDEECAGYKRRPIMTTEERVQEVRLCKYVSEVIPNVPVSGITEEMIRRYNVHIVCCGEEYDTPNDTYYAVPRRLGILRTTPRTDGISTSELIKRIRAVQDDELVAKDKLTKEKKDAYE